MSQIIQRLDQQQLKSLLIPLFDFLPRQIPFSDHEFPKTYSFTIPFFYTAPVTQNLPDIPRSYIAYDLFILFDR